MVTNKQAGACEKPARREPRQTPSHSDADSAIYYMETRSSGTQSQNHRTRMPTAPPTTFNQRMMGGGNYTPPFEMTTRQFKSTAWRRPTNSSLSLEKLASKNTPSAPILFYVNWSTLNVNGKKKHILTLNPGRSIDTKINQSSQSRSVDTTIPHVFVLKLTL